MAARARVSNCRMLSSSRVESGLRGGFRASRGQVEPMSEAVVQDAAGTGTNRIFAHEMIASTAREHPERIALVDGSGNQINYVDLSRDIRVLAARLRDLGVGPDETVAVLLPRSAYAIAAMLAIMAAGGVYCPLDASAPELRTTDLLRTLRPRVVLTDRGVPPGLPAGAAVLDAAGEVLVLPQGKALPVTDLCPDHLAYVIHTSGSTGRPKGVAMSHRGLMRLLRWQSASGPAGLRTLQFTATGFDVTFQEVLSTLATGG